MKKIHGDVQREICRLKYRVYERRVTNLLDVAEKKILEANEKLSKGEDRVAVWSKLKVSYPVVLVTVLLACASVWGSIRNQAILHKNDNYI